MFFYAATETGQSNFHQKVVGYIEYSSEDGFSIILTKEQLSVFLKTYPNLKLTTVSESYIAGSSASLYVFKK